MFPSSPERSEHAAQTNVFPSPLTLMTAAPGSA